MNNAEIKKTSIRVAVTTDAGSDLTETEAKNMGIFVVPMTFWIRGQAYREGEIDCAPTEAGIGKITKGTFFDLLRKGTDVTTSLPSPEDVMATWDLALKDHDAIVHIPLTEGLSGSAQEAILLAQEERYEGRVYVVRNRRISVTERQAVKDALTLARLGYKPADIQKILERDADKNAIYLTLGTLEYLKKGGRITPAAAAIGSFLKIKPILTLQKGGKIDAFRMGRTTRQCHQLMIEQLKKDLKERFHDPEAAHSRLAIAFSDDIDEVAQMLKELEEAFPNRMPGEIVISPLNLMLCCHTGYGCMGVAVIPECPETRMAKGAFLISA